MHDWGQQSSVPAPGATSLGSAAAIQLVGAARNDLWARYLFDALARRYGLAGCIDTELRTWQRYLVALATFHPSMPRWKERFFKSLLAFRLRSRITRMELARIGHPFDAVLQVNALFQTRDVPYFLYIDNTHHESVRGWPAWSPFNQRDLERWYGRERAIYRQAAHVFTMGGPCAESLIAFYGIPEERVTNVGAGANFDPLPTLSPSIREPVILFIGHDFHRKGGERLIEAFRRVRTHLPNARLRIVGSSDVPSEPGIEILGRIDDRQRIAQLYAEASVFCLPSYFEPFGLVLVEAMAYGLPCVSTTVGAIPEVVIHGETGLLVPPGDSAALAAALLRLVDDPAYAAHLGAAGRQRVEQHLNWDRVAHRMAQVFDRWTRPDAGRSAGSAMDEGKRRAVRSA